MTTASVPSTVSQGIDQPPAMRSASTGFAIWRATGVEYEYWLRWRTKTAGHLPDAREAERLVRVADGERALAEERERHPGLAAACERERRADRDRREVAEHRDEREDADGRDAEVHVPVASAGR